MSVALETAQGATSTVDTAAAGPGAGAVLEIMLALALVVASVFALAWLMRRLRSLPLGRDRLIRTIAEHPLGERERLVIVGMGSRRWLLGVTAGSVQLLQQLEPAETDGTALQSAPPGAANGLKFADVLRRSLGMSK